MPSPETVTISVTSFPFTVNDEFYDPYERAYGGGEFAEGQE
jgi:hypothetical protein